MRIDQIVLVSLRSEEIYSTHPCAVIKVAEIEEIGEKIRKEVGKRSVEELDVLSKVIAEHT